MMHMEHRQIQTQTQRLMLTQRMQQAIQILQYSGLELDQYIQQEIETNPVLESIQESPEPPAPEMPSAMNNGDDPIDDSSLDLDNYTSQWKDISKEGRDLSYNPYNADKRQFYMDSITKEESFSSMLLSQLRMATDDEQMRLIGERIIGDMDDRGYFTDTLEDICSELDVPLEKAEKALRLIQRFEPTGVGARDVLECLHLQIEAKYPDDEELAVLVSEHLDELERRQIPKIAKAMKISTERVEELKELLTKLNPWPGHEYSLAPTQYVTPDVIVEKINGEYVVALVDELSPTLRVSGDYADMINSENTRRNEKKYLREKVESAKWLIRNIEQRKQTILRTAAAIVSVQEGFLDKGVEFIKPLTLQEIADKVGVHEATISRATRGKYMQCPQGLFELKYFFSPGLKSKSGEMQSSKSVQSIVKKIVDEENRSKPLSDQKIANILKENGLTIARRTVTKYREALGIPSTTMRRQY